MFFSTDRYYLEMNSEEHKVNQIIPTLDAFILASKKFHAFWFTRLISYFNVSYLGFSPL